MKQRWRKEAYVKCCYTKERNGIAWWRIGIWKMRGIRKGFEKGRSPYVMNRRLTSING
jgi:hypothetical protein